MCALPSPPSPSSPSHQPKCPRCDSVDTKFSYYNNYSTSQPRYFCRNCKRYWTEGGSLRNLPIGAVPRKNKKILQNATLVDAPASKRYKSNTNPKDVELSSPYRRSISGSSSASDPPETSEFSHCAPLHNAREDVVGNKERGFPASVFFTSHDTFEKFSHVPSISRATDQCTTEKRLEGECPRDQQEQSCDSRDDEDEIHLYSRSQGSYSDSTLKLEASGERLVDAHFDDALSNVVSISYPFDWQQVSEWLFGRNRDFLYYVVPGGNGGFDTGAN